MGLKAQYLDRCSKHIRLHQEYEKLYQEHKKLHQQHQKLLRDYVKVSNALIKENQTLREFQKLLPQLVEFVDKALDDDQTSPPETPSRAPTRCQAKIRRRVTRREVKFAGGETDPVGARGEDGDAKRLFLYQLWTSRMELTNIDLVVSVPASRIDSRLVWHCRI